MPLPQCVGKHAFPSALPPLLAILILAGVFGCGRDPQPGPASRRTIASPQGTSEAPLPSASDDRDGGPREPEAGAANQQRSPSGGGSSEDKERGVSVDESPPEQSGHAPSAAEAEAPQPLPEKGDPSPVDALKALGAMIKMNVTGEVIGVDLKGTEVTDADLAHLKGMTRIKTLNLSQTRVTDEGLSNLEGMADLTYLYLFSTDVTDAGLRHLSGLSRIELLCLDETRITDAGLAHLKNMTGLKTLHIQSKQTITDAGLDLLTGFAELTELRVGGTEVTGEGVTRLKQLLPKCLVAR